MSNRSGPIYENSIFVDEGLIAELETWLDGRIRDVRTDAGVGDVQLVRTTGKSDPGLILQILFVSDEAIDEFLAGQSTVLETEIDDHAEQRAIQSPRVLREDLSHNVPSELSPNCLNCGTPLRGQYCGQCGQRARSRLISLWELIRDAFGDLFELDSRLWQTLIPLLLKPGKLTDDYLKGRRARYMPPFRMYLVLSLIFFVTAFFDPSEELAIFYEDQSAAETAAEPPVDGEEPVSTDEQRAEASSDTGGDVPPAPGESPASETETGAIEMADLEDGPEFNVVFDGEDVQTTDCNADIDDVNDIPDWLKRRLTEKRLRQICEQMQLDDGEAFTDKLIDNIPAALIILLPLMALALKILYPLARRYYVEHLLFFVHFHSFFFLILSLQILFARLADAVSIPDAITVITLVVTSLYIPVYLFKSMRQVYGQGWFLTFLKYTALLTVYTAGFGIMMLGALLIAAFSII